MRYDSAVLVAAQDLGPLLAELARDKKPKGDPRRVYDRIRARVVSTRHTKWDGDRMRRSVSLALLLLALGSGCASVKAGANTIGAGVTLGIVTYAAADKDVRDGEASAGFGAVMLGGAVVFVGVLMMAAGAIQSASADREPQREKAVLESKLLSLCVHQHGVELGAAEALLDPAERAGHLHAVRLCTDEPTFCRGLRDKELRAARAISDADERGRALHASRRCSEYDQRARGQEYGSVAECEVARREVIRAALTLPNARERGQQIVAAPVCEPADYAPIQ